jgi:thiamine pyrophosphate-dependent acetolactate synthase large subunit-like protein
MARLTGVPGVAAVTAGPGVTNTITAIKNAQMAQVPLVLLGGAAATIMKGRGSLQDIDQRAVLEPIVKQCFTINTVRDIVPSLREAFQVASSGVPGPVFVELPLDVLYCPLDIMVEMGWFARTRRGRLTPEDMRNVVVPEEALKVGMGLESYLSTLRQDSTVFLKKDEPNPNPLFVQAYLGLKLKYVHGNTPVMNPDAVDFTPLPVHVPMPKSSEILQTSTYLRSATRPVLVLGSQVTIEATLMNRLAEAVDFLGVPTFLGGMARGLLGRNGRCFVRQGRTNALAQSDCVILCGEYLVRRKKKNFVRNFSSTNIIYNFDF